MSTQRPEDQNPKKKGGRFLSRGCIDLVIEGPARKPTNPQPLPPHVQAQLEAHRDKILGWIKEYGYPEDPVDIEMGDEE